MGAIAIKSFAADVLLEGTQVLYWATLIALRAQVSWAELRPDRALDTQVEGMSTGVVAKLLRAEASTWRNNDQATAPLAPRVHATLGLVGQAISIAGHTPEAIVSKDLGDLRSRPYLAGYFARTFSDSPNRTKMPHRCGLRLPAGCRAPVERRDRRSCPARSQAQRHRPRGRGRAHRHCSRLAAPRPRSGCRSAVPL